MSAQTIRIPRHDEERRVRSDPEHQRGFRGAGRLLARLSSTRTWSTASSCSSPSAGRATCSRARAPRGRPARTSTTRSRSRARTGWARARSRASSSGRSQAPTVTLNLTLRRATRPSSRRCPRGSSRARMRATSPRTSPRRSPSPARTRASSEPSAPCRPRAPPRRPTGTLDIPIAAAGLAYKYADADRVAGSVKITAENPQTTDHNIAIPATGSTRRARSSRRRHLDGHRRPQARHLHVLLLRARPPRGRHGRQAHRQVAGRRRNRRAARSERLDHERDDDRHHEHGDHVEQDAEGVGLALERVEATSGRTIGVGRRLRGCRR